MENHLLQIYAYESELLLVLFKSSLLQNWFYAMAFLMPESQWMGTIFAITGTEQSRFELAAFVVLEITQTCVVKYLYKLLCNFVATDSV